MTAPDFNAALAALNIWAVEVEVAGVTYRIPPRPASEWFVAVISGEDSPIVPGLLEPVDEEAYIDRLIAGEITAKETLTANRDALAAASGWKWWMAERLIVSAAAEWRMIGGLIPLDVGTVSLGRMLSTIYALAVTNMSKEDRFQFDARLQAPPVGYSDAAEWFDESVYADAFADLLAQHQQTLPTVVKQQES